MDRKALLKTETGAGPMTAAGGLATAVTVAGAAATYPLERRTMDKVTWRLIPFLIVCYFIAFLDRVNVGFANATMSKDLALSAAAFGGAAGIFFIGYFFFEVPSSLALNKFGARVWIARIMFTWGIISGAQAFVVGETSLNIVRFMLGIAEAGFFPGIIFFLTLWFPAGYRARIIGLFMIAVPVSTVVGSPISGFILDMEGVGGLHGWQWMFLIEAFPALLMTPAVLYYLTDRPALATWLEPLSGNGCRSVWTRSGPTVKRSSA
jgi:ACS family tartrate transporter-like MFS transporter